MQDLNLNKIFELDRKAKENAKRYVYKRFLYDTLKKELKTKIYIGVSGLRGAGKTILLLQLASSLKNSLYLSCDIVNKDLFEIIKTLSENYKIKYFFLDEVHYAKDWEKEIKLAYELLDVKIFFTSSVSLNILQAPVDLSRRIKLLHLPLLSFREYFLLKEKKEFPLLNLEDILNNWEAHLDLLPVMESAFLSYLTSPLPFLIENPDLTLFKNIISKIIQKDLAINYNLTIEEIQNLEDILKFIALSPIGETNYSVISHNLKMTKYKAKKLVSLLQEAYLVNIIQPKGRNIKKEPKILLTPPTRQLFSKNLPSQMLMGALKEEYLAYVLNSIPETELFYLKTKRGKKTPDYLFKLNNTRIILEVGGKGKGFSQFKEVKEDLKKIITTFPYVRKKNSIPLVLFGLLW